MTSRQQRRALDRKSRKLAHDKSQSAAAQPESASPATTVRSSGVHAPPASPAQVAANRANAALSTGPKTTEGKVKSSLNAVKIGLTGKTILLPTDDAAVYQHHVERFFSEHTPISDRESELVQALADTQWRLNRIPALETGIYAIGRRQCEDLFEHDAPELRPGLIDAQVFITFQRQLNNLSIQEQRLHRYYQKAAAELASLQESRRQDNPTIRQIRVARRRPALPIPEFGFDFSTDLTTLLGIPSDLISPGQRTPEGA